MAGPRVLVPRAGTSALCRRYGRHCHSRQLKPSREKIW
jgi:hypothetical protein